MKKKSNVKKSQSTASKSATKSQAAKNSPAVSAPAKSTGPSAKTPLLTKEPQSKKDAALQKHIYLKTDDNWSNAYFDHNDLHFVERDLFG